MDELWNIILCVSDENLADQATRFLLELYYTKQVNNIRRQMISDLHEYFLKAVYARLNGLMKDTILPSNSSNIENENYFQSLRNMAEQLSNESFSSCVEKTDHSLWLQKIERLLKLIEKYIDLVEHENSPTAHRNSFFGLEYQLKIVHGDAGKPFSSYDIAVVHSNDTLDTLRLSLAGFYKVFYRDILLSSENFDENGTNHHRSTNYQNTLGIGLNSKYLYELEIGPGSIVYMKILGSTTIQLNKTSRRILLEKVTHRNFSSSTAATFHSMPSNMLAQKTKIYDILYKLSFLRNQRIDQRIRNLLYLMPSDVRVLEQLDQISTNSPSKRKEILREIFHLNRLTFIELLYNFEILSSQILPSSTNNGIQESSKLFQENFLQHTGLEFLFDFLENLTKSIPNDYQYRLCQELTIFILKLLELFLRRVDLPTDEMIKRVADLIFLSWAGAAGNLRFRRRTKSGSSGELEFGICLKSGQVSPLDCQIAETIIELIVSCFEKCPTLISS